MRLIDADALKEYIGIGGTETSCKGCKYRGDISWNACNLDKVPSFDFICTAIDDAPTAEINEDMIIEYCRKRHLVIMTAELFSDWFMNRRIDESYE